MKENLIEELNNHEYELTINTIEGDRIEINDMLTLQNSMMMLIDYRKTSHMDFQVFVPLEKNAGVKTAQAINSEIKKERNTTIAKKMKLQPKYNHSEHSQNMKHIDSIAKPDKVESSRMVGATSHDELALAKDEFKSETMLTISNKKELD